jgi:Fe-S cluster biogenesis protein NfuA
MRTQDEIIKDIKIVLEEKVAPSVAAHNGSIGFIDFAPDTGVATLKLSGSCSGCAMSKITLQRGVEQTLKHYVPEVKSIVGKDDEQAAEQGYDPYFPKDKEPDWERLLRKTEDEPAKGEYRFKNEPSKVE